MTLDLRLAERRGPELVLRAVREPRRAPLQPLHLDRLLDGGALSGPMFRVRPGLLRRLWASFVPRRGLGMRRLSMRIFS